MNYGSRGNAIKVNIIEMEEVRSITHNNSAYNYQKSLDKW